MILGVNSFNKPLSRPVTLPPFGYGLPLLTITAAFFDFRPAQHGQVAHKNWKKDKKMPVHYIVRSGPDILVTVPPSRELC